MPRNTTHEDLLGSSFVLSGAALPCIFARKSRDASPALKLKPWEFWCLNVLFTKHHGRGYKMFAFKLDTSGFSWRLDGVASSSYWTAACACRRRWSVLRSPVFMLITEPSFLVLKRLPGALPVTHYARVRWGWWWWGRYQVCFPVKPSNCLVSRLI